MGLLSALGITKNKETVEAQYAPAIMDTAYGYGSFTTGVACVNLNRKFIGIELDKDYFDIGVNRIKERIKCLDLKIEPMISMGD